MKLFTVEETNFMSYFDTSSRQALIHDMSNTPLNDLGEEMSEMLYRLVKQLETMTDEGFSQVSIIPDECLD